MPSREFDHMLAQLKTTPAADPMLPIPESRKQIEVLFDTLPLLAGSNITAVDAGGVRAEWVQAPTVSRDPGAATVLYLHGGGYTLCSPRTHRAVTTHLSQAAGCRVLAIAYRLAPEHPLPAGIEDAAAAYRWLLAQGIAPGRIALAGDAAGGGLAVATLVRLREEGTPLPAAAYLVSPWVDLAATGASWERHKDQDPLVNKAQLDRMAAMYLAGRDLKTPLASPLYADLTGLPPLLVQVGTKEVLFDDATGLVARAKEVGVAATLRTWEEMIHGFYMFTGMVPEADAALSEGGRFLRERLLAEEVSRPAAGSGG